MNEETVGDCDNGNWLLFGHFATIYEGRNDGRRDNGNWLLIEHFATIYEERNDGRLR